MYTVIFLGGFLLGWLLCAYLPWLGAAVATHGRAGMGMLALCLFAGVVCAAAVPVLGVDGGLGLGLSFPMAAAVSAALLSVRRLTAAPRQPPGEPTN